MSELDWIVKNWDFLSARRVKRIPQQYLPRLLRDSSAPTLGRFYGTPEFLEKYQAYSCVTNTGTARLLLRPYIIAPMPEEGIKAVFIDPKKYEFDGAGNITGLKSLYESPIYILVD